MKPGTYRVFFERSEDASLIIVGGKIVDCNASAVEMLRYKNKQDLLNKHPSQISPEYQPNGMLSFQKADEMVAIAIERGFHRFEWEHMRADGAKFPVEVSITAVKEHKQDYLHVVLRDITRQRKAEDERLEIERKLKAIFNHRFQLTGLLAADGKLLMANETACKLVAADCKELEGKYFWELPHWSHSRALQDKVRNAIHSAQKGHIESFETTQSDSKGNLHTIDFSLTPVQNESGDVIFIVPEGHDITTRKQSEKRLIESERNYREIYNSSSEAILIHDDKTGNIIDVNKTMLEMYGYTYQEALQLEIGDISSGEQGYTQHEACAKIRKAVIEGPQLFVWSAKQKNGSFFWVEVALRKTTIGGEGRVLAVVRDITQRKQLDTELRLVKYSIEHSAYPFEWIQDDSRFLYVNEATCRSLGYTCEELCSMKVGDIDPDFSDEAWPEFWEKLKSQQSLSFETFHYKKNGDKFPVEIMANYVEFEGQGHVFAYVQDISDRILNENIQKQLQEQLQQAQKMEALGTLAGGIAHDFNNILSGIFGYAELAKIDIGEPVKLKDDLNSITSGAERAKELVNQILTFSRKSEVEKNPLQLSLVIKEVLKLIRPSIPTSIDIKRNIRSNGLALADPSQMHQVVMNLCTNAYHAMRETGGRLSVSLTDEVVDAQLANRYLEAQTGHHLKLTISDTGHGMGKDTLDYIFEPYFTTKEVGDGTGLGLSVVHGIVTQCGGFISVNSEIGKGTTFDVYLPLYVREGIEKSTVEDGLPPVQLGTETIMFVDDEERICEVATRVLEKYGYQVSVFSNGYSAWQEYKAHPDRFDLVVTDMTMPQMNGLELVTHILRLTPDKSIILCTGHSDLINRKTALAIGVGEYFQKPVAFSELAYAIHDMLNGNSKVM